MAGTALVCATVKDAGTVMIPVTVTSEGNVEAPVFSPAPGDVLYGTEISLSCATDGAVIY